MTDQTESRTAAQTLTFADILQRAKPARRSVFLVLDAELMAVRDQLEHDIDEAARLERLQVRDAEGNAETSLGDTAPTDRLVAELADVIARMRDSRTRFTFQVLPQHEWDTIRKQFETEPGKVDWDAASVPLIAASCVEPEMTQADVTTLFEQVPLNLNQRQTLFEAAWAVNTGAVDVPFSPAGSAAEKARVSGKK